MLREEVLKVWEEFKGYLYLFNREDYQRKLFSLLEKTGIVEPVTFSDGQHIEVPIDWENAEELINKKIGEIKTNALEQLYPAQNVFVLETASIGADNVKIVKDSSDRGLNNALAYNYNLFHEWREIPKFNFSTVKEGEGFFRATLKGKLVKVCILEVYKNNEVVEYHRIASLITTPLGTNIYNC